MTSMDRSKLLEELVKLKRLLNEHENKISSINIVKLKGNKCSTQHLERRNENTIFFNPKKLNPVQNKSTTELPNNTSNLVTKVFINPNFKNSNSLSSSKAPSRPKKQEEKPHQLRNKFDESKISYLQDEYKVFKKECSNSLSTREKNVNHCSRNYKVSNETPSTNSRVIFVNPEFASSSRISTQLNVTTSKTASKKHVALETFDKKSNSNFDTIEPNLAGKMCQKRKLVLGENSTESRDNKRMKEKQNIGSVKKIFVNPRFEKNESDCKNTKSTFRSPKTSVTKAESSFLSPSSSSIQKTNDLDTKCTSRIPVLLGGKEVQNKLTTVTSASCAIGGPENRKQAKRTTYQRIRTCSTSLITVSTTKLVRKRKLSHKRIEISGKALSQPLFVSKTKLVRNLPKKELKIGKFRQCTPIPCVQSEKLNKLRRKSLDENISLKSLSSKQPIVTKIKSKNGKSLKLIRKSSDSLSFRGTGEKLKTQNLVNSKKMELRQQASRFTMTLVKSRLKRNQFSKINVPTIVRTSPSYNKNIYKINNVLPRKTLTKADLCVKREASSFFAKNQVRNSSLDMTKFIKSKYRLVRKPSSNLVNRYRLGQKILNKIVLRDKLLQRQKLKWKQKSCLSKRKLTRKDLSIKKIGGVFYQYSRTTLAKQKQNSKQVSQPQKKGMYQVSTGGRQSRYSLNKNPGRKRLGSAGGVFTTSTSRMSWKKAGYCAARSILKQAKQKSIYLLSKKMKKNNEPCLFYHRYGQCSGHDRGTCVRLHDKKYVAVCKKYVQGSCTDEKCCLSHSPSSHNMPTCHHFLAGQCGRDNCLYPHIKVSDCAPICLEFLKGYCQLGDQCAKRHFEICPSFEKGTCPRSKYCPYPHPKSKMGENLKGKFKHIKRKPQRPKETQPVSTPSLRYFEDVNLQKENQIHLDEDQSEHEDNSEAEDGEITCSKKRPHLGDLPSFIPLSQSRQDEDL